MSYEKRSAQERERLATEEGLRQYLARQATVEPVIGWIKSVLGYRRFLLRGLKKVRGEWSLICAVINLRHLHRLAAAAGAAAVAVARKLAAYLLAVNRSGRPFQPRQPPQAPDSPAGKRPRRTADPAAPGPRHRIRRKPTARQSSPQRDCRLRPRPAVRPLRLFRGWQG